ARRAARTAASPSPGPAAPPWPVPPAGSAPSGPDSALRPATPAGSALSGPDSALRPVTPAGSAPSGPESAPRPATPAGPARSGPESSPWLAAPTASAPPAPAPASPDAAAGLPLHRRSCHPAGPVAPPAHPPGALVCVYGPGSAALARAVVARAGAGQVFLIREDAAAGEAHATLSG